VDQADEKSLLEIVVLVSGSGSNLQAIMDAAERGDIAASVRTVISDQPTAFGLQRADNAGVAHECLPGSDYPDRAAYDAALAKRLEELAPDLIVLAGFMRILTADLVNAWQGKMLNIHPSLLPDYRGLHTHRRVLEAGETYHGTTVHFVTEELDGGPLIAQSRLRIGADDDEESLVRRVLAMEHRMYPEVIGWIALGRLRLDEGQVKLDGHILDGPILIDEEHYANEARA
jgi:phosphoribosylglycinamide formyltransferase-1